MQGEDESVAILVIILKVRAYNSSKVSQHLLNAYKLQVPLEVLYICILRHFNHTVALRARC